MAIRVLLVLCAVLAIPATAVAHIERPSYFPDPAPDTSVTPATGGAVPPIRSLASALVKKLPGQTRVVCQPDSTARLKASVAAARKSGYDIRPSDHRALSAKSAKRLLALNKKLRKLCRYREIQPAVTASANNDRVVVMPGLYTEPTSRAAPTHDPKCDQYEVNTEFGDPGALSYAYQSHCPNDQNLIAVIGRAVGAGTDPDPPPSDRHGIPNLGACVRCNFQIEGSGVGADDVIVDAGRVESGNKGPAESKKDVGIRADRADGFVLRNMTVRHSKEDGIYVIESDGYVLDRFKVYYAGSYGTLTFVEDHGLQQNCEAVGHGDSGIYPGAAAETGVQRKPGTRFRYNQEIRWCDMHHNLAGYSATDGNAIHVHDNNVYENTLGLQTDVVTASGHPGYPGDSSLYELNNIYSNNFNPYTPDSDVKAAFPFPIGTGMWIAGGNHHTLRENHIFDNWRRGTMLFTVPDALICGPDSGNKQEGCEPSQVSTSHYNSYYQNVMGASPAGQVLPNGTDFWWDNFPDSRGNCWYWNTGPRPITTSPAQLPDCDSGKDPAASSGTGDAANQGELVQCLVAYETDNYDPNSCPWFVSPAKPGSRKARASSAKRVAARQALVDFCRTIGTPATCAPYREFLERRGVRLDPELAAVRAASPRSLGAWGLLGPAVPSTSKPLSQFDCTDWRRGDDATRRGVARRLTVFVGGRISARGVSGWGSVLTGPDAFALFDNRCAARGSSGLLLYKVYGFAAGMMGVAPPASLAG
jgi:hypothetical protein